MTSLRLMIVAASAAAALMVAGVETQAANPEPLSPEIFVAMLDDLT
ncbi:MAG: hypothetical protein Q8L59_02405 [Phenylobacterium sp.]|nr:hypothetical protein [Phenylobacterium sp.]MDP1641015.1 hypothetical protein [Phenylobacterium sp.]MDP3117324.1 hypothetical protein [Phenylobacterium sp.]MDP3383547.1 hypothetical protein [Phenylobacterium sp.]